MNLPVVGPERLQFQRPVACRRRPAVMAKPARSEPLPDTAEHGTIKPTETRHGQSSTATPEAVPEPYREAVKRYLTP